MFSPDQFENRLAAVHPEGEGWKVWAREMSEIFVHLLTIPILGVKLEDVEKMIGDLEIRNQKEKGNE